MKCFLQNLLLKLQQKRKQSVWMVCVLFVAYVLSTNTRQNLWFVCVAFSSFAIAIFNANVNEWLSIYHVVVVCGRFVAYGYELITSKANKLLPFSIGCFLLDGIALSFIHAIAICFTAAWERNYVSEKHFKSELTLAVYDWELLFLF